MRLESHEHIQKGISKAADGSRMNSSIEGHLSNIISLTYEE